MKLVRELTDEEITAIFKEYVSYDGYSIDYIRYTRALFEAAQVQQTIPEDDGRAR